MVELTISGVLEFDRFLDLLTKKSLDKVGKGAETAAMNVLVKSIRGTSVFNDRTGLLRKAQGQKPWKKGNYQVAIVGARKRFEGTYKGKSVVLWRYEHLVHGGHELWKGKKGQGGVWIGTVAPRKFHKESWDATKGAVASVFVNEFKRRWDDAVNQAITESGVVK